MTEEDLERAVTAAVKCGLSTPEEIASFAIEWLSPIMHLEVREPTAEDMRSDLMAFRLTIVRPVGAIH